MRTRNAAEDDAGGAEPRSREALAALVEGYRWRLLLLAATSLIGGLAEAFFLVVVTRAAFAISERSSTFDLWSDREVDVSTGILISLALVILRVSMAVSGGAESASLMSSVIASLRRRLSTAFLSSSWTVQQRERSGQLQELLTTFTAQATSLISSVTTSITSIFNLLALIGLAVAVDPRGSMVVVVFVAILGSVLRPVRNVIRKRGKRSASVGMKFATSLSEISQLGMEVHVFHVQMETETRVIDLIDQSAESDRRLTFARTLVPSLYAGLAYLGLVAALAVVNAAEGTSLVSIGAVMLVMLRSLSYGQALQTSSSQMAATMPYLHAIHGQLAVYQAGRQVDGGQAVDDVRSLRFDSVSFAYEPGVPVLSNLSFTIGEREVVGIVGPSGGGKSTLVQLMLGLREPDQGTVTADGRPLHTLSRGEWARRVTFVPQAAHLIAGTVADNIRFLRSGVSDDDIVRAAHQANLADDIEKFPDRYQREVGDRGDQLSGGQQQRLCIARALVEDPDVLILDEPTSALDMRSEQLIRQTLLELSDRMTIIIIAHRLSTLDICDRIMVIQDGELRGFDTPEELEKANDFYREALVLSGMR